MKCVKKIKYIIIIIVFVIYYRIVLLYDINISDNIIWGIVIKKKELFVNGDNFKFEYYEYKMLMYCEIFVIYMYMY